MNMLQFTFIHSDRRHSLLLSSVTSYNEILHWNMKEDGHEMNSFGFHNLLQIHVLLWLDESFLQRNQHEQHLYWSLIKQVRMSTVCSCVLVVPSAQMLLYVLLLSIYLFSFSLSLLFGFPTVRVSVFLCILSSLVLIVIGSRLPILFASHCVYTFSGPTNTQLSPFLILTLSYSTLDSFWQHHLLPTMKAQVMALNPIKSWQIKMMDSTQYPSQVKIPGD